MPKNCIIPGCFREKNRSIFAVPKTIERREKWLKAIRDVYSNLDVGKNFSVCEKHFQITDFTSYIADQTGKIVHEAVMQRKRLKHGAVPRLDLGQIGNDSMEQNKPRTRLKKIFDYRFKDSDGYYDEMYQQNKFGVTCDSLSTPTLQRSTNTSGDKNIIRTYLRQADYKKKERQKKIGNVKELEKPLREENVFAAVNHLEAPSRVPAVVIKKEYDSEDTVSPPDLDNGLLKLKEDYITDKYLDMIPNKDEVTSVIVKKEFDDDYTVSVKGPDMAHIKLQQDFVNNMIQNNNEVTSVIVKKEFDNDYTVSVKDPDMAYIKLQQDFVNNMIQNNDEVTSVVVKMEFDAKDTVLHMGQVKLKQDLANSMIQDHGFVVKKEVEEYEVVIKQELDVDVVTMQPKNTPHP